MTATKTLTEAVEAIEAELARRGWTDRDTYYASDDDALPAGWVRVSGEDTESYGPAAELLAELIALPADAPLSDLVGREEPTSSRDWPEESFETEQLEEGTCNDQPTTLVRVETNGGTRWAIGPHGVFNCALADALNNDCLYKTREQAVESCDYETEEESEEE